MNDHTPCANGVGNREARMVEAIPDVWCDPCIAPLVAALNAAGIRTVASCCGHGRNAGSIALADGRVLEVHPSLDGWTPTPAGPSW